MCEDVIDIKEYADFLYLNIFGKKLEIPVEVNGRMKNTIAWFRDYYVKDVFPKRGKEKIEVSKHLLEQNLYVITDVLIHELCHYYLWKNKLPFDDEDEEFKNLCTKCGATLTRNFIVEDIKKDEYFKMNYIEYTARHSCGYTNKIYYRNTDDKIELAHMLCPYCKKIVRYKRTDDEKILNYLPTKKVKKLVSLWRKENR